MIRKKYLLLFVVSFTILLVGCDNDLGHQSPDDEWTAETLVSQADVERSGVDAWFRSETISDQIMTGSTTKISKHGLGLAIDINTLYNPYVKQKDDESWHIEPATGEPYAFDRENKTDIPYKIDHNDLAYRLFTEAGFEWGGDWTSLKDYKHFEIDL